VLRPDVHLLIIAKNEAHVIGRALASGKALGVTTMTVVLDERTTDNTREVALAAGAGVVIRSWPGSLAAARNDAIDVVKHFGGYILLLDADDVYEGRLPAVLTSDVYDVWIHDDALRFPRIQLFRSECPVRFEGIRHERAVPPEGASRAIAATLIYKRVGGGEQDKMGRRAKFMTHARDLMEWLRKHPEDAHSLHMLAQSWRDAGEVEDARATYERRVAMGPAGDAQEQYLAALETAFLVEHHDTTASTERVMGLYLRAHEMAPLHAEPLFHLACYLRERGCVAAAWHFARRAAELPVPQGRAVIIDVEIYRWKALAELAVESWMLGDRGTAMELLQRITREQPAYAEWAEEQHNIVANENPTREPPKWPRSWQLPVRTVAV